MGMFDDVEGIVDHQIGRGKEVHHIYQDQNGQGAVDPGAFEK